VTVPFDFSEKSWLTDLAIVLLTKMKTKLRLLEGGLKLHSFNAPSKRRKLFATSCKAFIDLTTRAKIIGGVTPSI